MSEDAEAAPPVPTAKVEIPAVTSSGQRNGVTAGYVNQLTQTVVPNLVRGPQLERFKATFSTGSKLYREFRGGSLTDIQIDELCGRADEWLNETFQWIRADVSDYAAERFLFRPQTLSFSYNLQGEHAPGYVDKWGKCQQGLGVYLVNLDQLMRDPSIYPEPEGS